MEQLKLLMNYTIFHIGLYTTLSTALMTLLGVFPERAQIMRPQLAITLFCFLVAGIFGGLVASHIPHVRDFDGFYDSAWIGPFGCKLLPTWLCMRLEHIFFWVGIGTAVWGLSKVDRQQAS